MRRAASRLLFGLPLVLIACGQENPRTLDDSALLSPEAVPWNLVDGGPGAFFPLTEGNTWNYERVIRAGGPGMPPDEFVSSVERTTGTTMSFQGQDYRVLEERYIEGEETILYCILTRQDRSGLFEADRSISECGSAPQSRASLLGRLLGPQAGDRYPAAKARLTAKLNAIDLVLSRGLAGTPAAGSARLKPLAESQGELVRLHYPLRPGQTWEVRGEPLFTAEVVNRDRLATQAGSFSAWRIAIHPPGLEEGDYLHVWYGREGYLGHQFHLTSTSTPAGDPLVFEETMLLTGLHIGGRLGHHGRS
jgi:hypothetical protein